MFDNIGSKLKGVAKVVTWLGIFGSCLGGFILLMQSIDNDEIFALYGILLAGLGSLFSWLGSLTLYGFGHLIENSDLLVEQGRLRQMKSGAPAAPATPVTPAYAAPVAPAYPTVVCRRCGATKIDGICPVCHKGQLDSLNRGMRDGFLTASEYQHRLEELRRD